jgi:hypothetical protein
MKPSDVKTIVELGLFRCGCRMAKADHLPPYKNAHTIYSKFAGLNLHLRALFREKVVENSGAGAVMKESYGKLGAV